MARFYESSKRILVTGGAGFLGSHLTGRLLSEGHHVLCADMREAEPDHRSAGR